MLFLFKIFVLQDTLCTEKKKEKEKEWWDLDCDFTKHAGQLSEN